MAKYKNASALLPPHLLADVQRYAAGLQLYVPRPAGRLKWGERNGTKDELARRNETIRELRRCGVGIDELMSRFHLGYDSIRKIVTSGQATRSKDSGRAAGGEDAAPGKNASTRTG